MLARASFQNFKALRAVEVDLAPFTVLVGKNGSGKTSVLQAIHEAGRVVRRPRKRGAQEWLDRVFGGSHAPDRLVTRPGSGPIAIALTAVDGSTLRVEAHVVADVEDQDAVRFVVALSGHDPPSINLPTTTPQGERWTQSLLSLAATRGFGSAVFLRLDPSVMVTESVPSSEEPRLGHDGEGLASVLAYLAGAEPVVLEAVRADLTKIVPEVRGIRTFPARITRRRREAVTVDSEPMFEEQVMGHRFALDMGAGRLVPADMLSEGTVLALGLLTVLHDPGCPKLVLMDDVDAALHSTAQADLVRCLRAVLASRPDVQIVCTSHSPYLLDHVTIDEVRVMALDADGHAQCRRLGAHPDTEKWRKIVRTGEFWASVGEDWILGAPADAR